MSNFKVGDRIVVKEWNDMVEEFGVNKRGVIEAHGGFYEEMRELCGKTGTIKGINEKSKFVMINFDDCTAQTWFISTDMVKHNISRSKPFTMDMLKTGMRVETREGELYLVLKDCDTMYNDGHIVFANFDQNGFLCEEDYDNDLLEQSGMEEYDIVKVYAIDKEKIVFGTVLDPNEKYLIWERSEDDMDDECEGCDFNVNGKCTIEEDEEDLEADIVLDILGLGKMFGFFNDEDDEDECDYQEDGTMSLDDFLDMLLETKEGCEEKDEPDTKIDHEEILKDMLWEMFLDFMDEEDNKNIK